MSGVGYKGYNLLKFFDVVDSFTKLIDADLLKKVGAGLADLQDGPVEVVLQDQVVTIGLHETNKMRLVMNCPLCGKSCKYLLMPHEKDPRRKKEWACKDCHGAGRSSELYGSSSLFEVEVFRPLKALKRINRELAQIFANERGVSAEKLAELIHNKNHYEKQLANNTRYTLYRTVLESGGLTDVTRPRA